MTPVDAVRSFSRFYTRQMGVLQEHLHDRPYSLAEVRVLYELAHRRSMTAAVLRRDLGLDAGYLSRILRRFERDRLLRKSASPEDGRQVLLDLTVEGRKVFEGLNRRSNEQVEALVGRLSDGGRRELVETLARARNFLGDTGRKSENLVLREHRAGDLGWIVERHGVLYSQEYGWGMAFEGLVAEIAGRFARNYDPTRERCWIAELEGERLGCVMLVKDSDEVGRLRLLLVEPHARGLGVGRRLVEECIRSARAFGYEKLALWTNDVLTAARRIYEHAGFRLVEQKAHRTFGPELIGQEWELSL